MSRIGKKPVVIPAGVEATLSGNMITVKGPKGTLLFAHHHDVAVKKAESEMTVEVVGTSKKAAGIWGTTVILLSNMIEGVTKELGFNRPLNGPWGRVDRRGEITAGFWKYPGRCP